MVVSLSGSLETDLDGFVRLAELCRGLDASQPGEHTVDCQRVSWLDGNLCAALRSLLSPTMARGGRVFVSLPSKAVADLWKRNGFGGHLDLLSLPDRYDSTIPFKVHPAGTHRAAHRHVHDTFAARRGVLPSMSPRLLDGICGQICEVFDNAFEHADSRVGAFSCGQYFRKKNLLHYTVADAGIGFAGSVSRRLVRCIDALDAVHWATTGHTSRTGARPGGSGLRLLREFVSLNRGRLVIASGDAYWEQHADDLITARLPYAIPGACVSLVIRTDDKRAYDLAAGTDNA